MPQSLSTEDWRIVHLLAEEAGDLEQISRELGWTIEETRDRIASLRERGILGEIAARVRPEAVGLPVTAFYVIRVAQNMDTYEAVGRLLKATDQVEEAHAVSGQYDWLVKVRAASVEDLQHLLTAKFALMPGFVRAETLVVLSTACDYANVHAATYPLEG
jgi:Lrp/AsnC family transcriptional regulator, regulator for asnA, asnC and gidA